MIDERDAALERAIRLAEGPAALARFITEHYGQITAQAICDWKRCPAPRVLQVEAATNGEVTRHELRPDLYPDEPKKRPSGQRAAA